jgi:hypothetical protein
MYLISSGRVRRCAFSLISGMDGTSRDKILKVSMELCIYTKEQKVSGTSEALHIEIP